METNPVDDVNGQELAALEAQFTIFVGSSPEDVSYAKTFWNSLALQPPIESRLVSADISQRLKVAKVPSIKTATRPNAPQYDALFEQVYEQRTEEDKQKYKDMAKRRDQIMMLLNRQREERIKREIISQPFKPKPCHQSNSRRSPEVLPEDLKEDIEHVRSLE